MVTHAGGFIVVDVVDGVRYAGVLRPRDVRVVRFPVFLRRERKRECDMQYDATRVRVICNMKTLSNEQDGITVTHLDDDVLQKSISFNGIVDLRLVFTAEVDGFRVASSLKIEDPVIVPPCPNNRKMTSANLRHNKQETFPSPQN